MHAVLVQVTLGDVESALEALRNEVVPRVSQARGFVAGYWLEPQGDKGWSTILFESEEAAREAVDRLQPPPMVTIDHVDVREVVAHA